MKDTSGQVLLTDTVGFIDDLPPWLIEAFKAALEEVYYSDLVLLVIDISESIHEILRKLRTSWEILSEDSLDILPVLNKVDMVSESELERKKKAMQNINSDVVPISAKEGDNLDELIHIIRSRLLEKIEAKLTTYRDDGVQKLLHKLYEEAEVEDVKYKRPTEVTFRTDERGLGRIRSSLKDTDRIEVVGDIE
ncbi:MAG: GTP-binding protein [Candidatus Aenigmatarchaeota archaeon]